MGKGIGILHRWAATGAGGRRRESRSISNIHDRKTPATLLFGLTSNSNETQRAASIALRLFPFAGTTPSAAGAVVVKEAAYGWFPLVAFCDFAFPLESTRHRLTLVPRAGSGTSRDGSIGDRSKP